jgi:predicted lipoprotein with Yx(FWY)xxD motif
VRRILTLTAATLAVAALTASLASGSGMRARLQLRKTSVGSILVNSRGFTLYAFTKDSRSRDACTKIPDCLALWPVVRTSGKAIAGAGVNSYLIGAITLKGGVKQVTYAGHPLYTYVGDTGPGQTFYVNFFQFGGYWPAMNASGKEVK